MKKLLYTLGIISVTQCFAANTISLGVPESEPKITSIALTGTIKYNDKYDKTSTKQYLMSFPNHNAKYAIMLVEFKTESEDYGINWGKVINNLNFPHSAQNNIYQFGLEVESNNLIESKGDNFNGYFANEALSHITTSHVVAILPL